MGICLVLQQSPVTSRVLERLTMLRQLPQSALRLRQLLELETCVSSALSLSSVLPRCSVCERQQRSTSARPTASTSHGLATEPYRRHASSFSHLVWFCSLFHCPQVLLKFRRVLGPSPAQPHKACSWSLRTMALC